MIWNAVSRVFLASFMGFWRVLKAMTSINTLKTKKDQV